VAVPRPTRHRLEALARSFGFEAGHDALAAYETLAGEFLAAYDRVDELADDPQPLLDRHATPPSGDDDPLHAFLLRCSISERDAGPLAGRTVAVKDNIAVAGLPVLNGSPLLEGWVPHEDATVVRRLLDAGATIVGKTKVPAFCFDGAGITCYPPPQPLNPYSPSHLPGGSSSGSAVAVASGAADLALGTDQGGSVRMPASWSGCCGLKPTFGAVPYTGVLDMERTLDHVGPLATSVRDCAVLLEVLAGPDGLDSRQTGAVAGGYADALDAGVDGITVGVLREGFAWPGVSEADVDATVTRAAETIERAGARVRETSVPLHRDGPAIWSAIAGQGAAHQMWASDGSGTNHRGRYSPSYATFLARARRERAAALADTVKLSLLLAEHVTQTTGHRLYAKAQNLALRLADAYDAALASCDVLVLPTTPMKAMRRPDEPSVEQTIRIAFGVLHNTAPFNVSGHPALSVPCGIAAGLPVGLMVVGRRHDERTVLRVGAAFEAARGALPAPAVAA
jgi:amidase